MIRLRFLSQDKKGEHKRSIIAVKNVVMTLAVVGRMLCNVGYDMKLVIYAICVFISGTTAYVIVWEARRTVCALKATPQLDEA